MEDNIEVRAGTRNRILLDLKSIIKQVYHESVNHELSADNVTYITQLLIKRLNETLIFGLKQPQHGYWKFLQKILHPDSLDRLTHIDGFIQSSNLHKGRTWIGVSLLDDALVSYVNCFVNEKKIEKFYEDWSVVRHNDACNTLLSLLSGMESILFQFDVHESLQLPNECRLNSRLAGVAAVAPPLWSPPPSLSDSGVQLDRSDDYLNGNLVPEAEGAVVMRRKPKATLRHVSFHEDSLAKSPSGRKLRWDCENSRYSWAGEELDALRLPGLRGAMRGERGAPEGEEAPGQMSAPDLRSTTVTVPVFGGKRTRRLSTRKYKYDRQMLTIFTQQLDAEVGRHRRARSMHELELPSKLAAMLGLRGERRWSYKLWGGNVIVITAERLIILHKDLTATQLALPQIEQLVVLPHGHAVHVLTRKKTHVLTCGDRGLSHEVITRLSFQLHVAGLHQVCYRQLMPSDMFHVKQELVNRGILLEEDELAYLGLVRQHSTEQPESGVDKQGSVMYLTSLSNSWQPANMVLRGDSLSLYGETRSPILTVALTACVACERANFPGRPHTFTLAVRQQDDNINDSGLYQQLAKNADCTFREESLLSKWTNKSTVSQWVTRAFKGSSPPPATLLHIAAADEYQLSDWLQALLTVFCQGSNEGFKESEASNATLLVSEEMIVLLSDSRTPGAVGANETGQSGFTVLGSALIHDISAFAIGQHLHDSYCIIEFDCQEAGSATCDWLLHCGSRAELDQLRGVLEDQWQSSDPFPVQTVCDARCERTQDCLTREWFA